MSKGKAITQIKGDPEQTARVAELNANRLDKELEAEKERKPTSDRIFRDSIVSINQAKKQVNDQLETRKDRADFLRRAIRAAETDQANLKKRMEEIRTQEAEEKQQHNADMEQLRIKFSDIETALKSKVQGALQQLKGLREFQEHKHQLDQQKRQVTKLISDGKKQNAQELTDIHRKLVEQREFYENQLREQLAVARQFATDFADLHLDLATQKIADETKTLRDKMKEEDMTELEIITKNEKLRSQLKRVQQEYDIHVQSTSTVETRAARLKKEHDAMEARVTTDGQNYDDIIRAFRDESDFKVKELSKRAEELRNLNVDLKQKTAVAARELALAEERRYEKMKKEYELVNALNNAAVFVLTSLDKKVTSDDDEELSTQKSALNQIIRKLAMIKKAPPSSSRTPGTELRDVEVQTDKPRNPLLTGAKVSEPSTSSRASNPRSWGIQKFRDVPEYQRIFSGKRDPALGNRVRYRRK